MGRIVAFLYGLVAYVVFLGAFLYAIGFVTGLWVPKTLDIGPSASLGEALSSTAAEPGRWRRSTAAARCSSTTSTNPAKRRLASTSGPEATLAVIDTACGYQSPPECGRPQPP